jgi:hypothetical protein
MPAIRRFVVRTLALALVSTSTLVVPAAAQTSDGTSDGTVQQSPALTLAPDSGPPGSEVTAAGDGFADCAHVPDTPDSQSPPAPVPDNPTAPEDPSPTGPDILRFASRPARGPWRSPGTARTSRPLTSTTAEPSL